MFATDQVQQVQGVGHTRGVEPCRAPLVTAGIGVIHDPPQTRTQRPIFSWRFFENLRQQPGKQPNQEKTPDPQTVAPEPTRGKAAYDRFEARDTRLTGSEYLPAHDPEARGTYIEPADPTDIGNSIAPDTYANDPIMPQAVINAPGQGITDNNTLLTGNVQAEEKALHAIRMAYPGVKIIQFPSSTRTIPLLANMAADIVFPDGAVLARFVPSNQFDVWYTRQGNARVPLAADMGTGQGNNTSLLSEGMILNLDPAVYYYVKGMRSISAICANACFVNATFYIQG